MVSRSGSQGSTVNNNGIEEAHLMPDRVHMLISIPPKHTISQVVEFVS